MDVLALSDDANSELSDYTKVATSPWPLSQDHKPALKKCVPYHNRVSRERVRFCSVPTVEGQIPAESLRDSSGTSPGSVRTTRSPISLSLYRNADGTIFPKSSALRLTTHRLTVESDGKEDSRSPRSPSSPSASTSRHNSFAMVAENGDNSFDGRTVSQDCSSPKGGGRHIQTRELAPSEKIGDAELRREVSDFIRFAKRGNISNGKKKNQLALEGPKEPSLSEVTSSVQGFAATTWHHIMRGMRTLVGIVFRHRKDSHFNTADLSTMWVNPSNAKDFEITPGCLQMRHKIGAGSYGVVYLVEHKKTWARYAIKCVRKRSGRKQASFLKRSETEFHVWRETGSHPNIISLIAAFQTRSAFCFVMDFVSTGSLSLLLSRQDKPLREDEIKRMASQLAHALYTVHRLGFLHRDVSCSNVLVTAKHNVLLIDFGSSVIGNTATSRAGTLAYMAPEVLAGRSSGPGADWWSYGIVLFALFEGTTPMHIYANRCKIDLRKLSLRSRFSVMKRVSVPISPLLHMDKRNLLKDFLREEPKVRLGVRRKQDFNLIKQHAYFANVNWRPMDEALDKILRRKYNLPMENEDEPVSRTKTI